MKKIIFFICSITLLLCVSCKTQESFSESFSCEDVSKTSEMPWLTAIIEKGPTREGQKLLKIEKLFYRVGESSTKHVGFAVFYEVICCDIPHTFVYNCEGECIASYGGINGCSGECDTEVISHVTLYTAEE